MIDGFSNPEIVQFANAMNLAILSGDVVALKQLSQAFLDAGSDAVALAPMGFLTAIFCRAAVADIKNDNEPDFNPQQAQEDARQLFFEGQKVLKKLISSPSEMDLTLSTRWPLWGMAYLASLKV